MTEYTTKHLILDGALIDRDIGHPDVHFMLMPLGILTDHPVDRLGILIDGAGEDGDDVETVLDPEKAAKLRDWLIANLRAE